MAVEATIYSARPPLSIESLSAAATADRLNVRFLGAEAEVLDRQPTGPLAGHCIVIGWAVSDAGTTAAVDAALRARNKDAIDDRGHQGKLAWCELSCYPFDYGRFWAKYPDEQDEYEQSVEPKKLAAIKAAVTRYHLRSGARPAHCAELVGTLCGIIRRACDGVVD